MLFFGLTVPSALAGTQPVLTLGSFALRELAAPPPQDLAALPQEPVDDETIPAYEADEVGGRRGESR